MQLTPTQTLAVETTSKQTLCIAGPGSGKTRVLTERIKHLVANGTSPSRIAAITFTNAGAREMEQRLDAAGIGPLGYLGTLHGYSLRLLQKFGKSLGYGSRVSVMDAAQAEELLAECVKTVSAKCTAKALEAAKAAFVAGQPARTPVDQAIALYYRRLREASTVDFDTILRDALILLKDWRNVPTDTFNHLFVDEVQDSSPIDFQIYSRIPAAHRFYVGDPDQAIYSFRGGSVEGLLKLAADPDWQQIRLEENFRSTATICETAQTLIVWNAGRVDKRTISTRGKGESLFNVTCQLDTEEVGTLVGIVRHWISTGTDPNEIAVLARSNAIAGAIAEAAEALKVPVRKRKPPLRPHDWALARAAVELLNTPGSKVAGYNFLRARDGKEEADRAKRAVAQAMDGDYRNQIEGLPWGTNADGLPQCMARLGVSMEAIEHVRVITDRIVAPTLTLISFALAADFEHEEIGHGVTITSIHASKGREWSHVILAGCEQGQMPGTAKSRNTEEERRVLFVGLTRAKDVLCVSHALARRETFGRKQLVPAMPSQFLVEARIV